MIAMHLVVLAAVVALAAVRWLPGARWVYRAPLLGLAAWYTVVAVVVLSVAGAVWSLFGHVPATQAMVCAWWALCVDALSGGMGAVARLTGWAVAALLALVGTRAALAAARAVRGGLRCRREQVALLGVVGRRDAGLGALVIDDPRPAAYFVPGRGGAVVVTSGAMTGLPAAQLAAVLAHERAHAAGRHHLLLQGVRLLAAALPAVAVFAHARAQVDRLVEIRADDVAAGGHARLDLARALVACAEAAAMVPVEPGLAGAVAATGGDALERVHRLLAPPAPLGSRGRVAAAVGLLALASTPVLVVALAAVFPTFAACLPVG